MRKKPSGMHGRSPQCDKENTYMDNEKGHPASVNNFNHKNDLRTPTSSTFSNLTSFNNHTTYSDNASCKVQVESVFDRMKNAKLPNPELLDRLAMGKKAKVEKKDMLALTTKNYNLLPEIQKRKQDNEKKEFLKKQAKKVKEMDMVIFFYKIIRNEELNCS